MVPEGWEIRQVGEIAHVLRGASPRPKGDLRYYGGNVPRLMVSDVTRDGKCVTPKTDFLTEEGAKLSRPMPAGTLTIVCSGTVGIPSLLAVDACIHDGFLALDSLSESCNKDYLYYVFSSLRREFDSAATHGGVFTNLTTEILRNFKILLPPLDEQEKIAEILGSVDDAIAATQAVIDQTRKVKQGLLQQLLTRGIGHTKFKETAIGLIPEGWEVESLSELLTDIIPGRTPESQRKPASIDEWGILKVSAIGFGEFFQNENKVLPENYEIETKYIVQEGDVLITRANTSELVGATCVVPTGSYKLVLSDKTLRLVPDKKKVDPKFLCEVLIGSGARKFLSENATGTSGSMKNITQDLIRAFVMPLPPLEEQEKIVGILDSITCDYKAHLHELKHLNTVKQGLMQDLLTGRVRVEAIV